MRVISGKYKGHHLVSFDADHIRPTTDRVKESLFNILRDNVDGARVLDLFSGTGGLGIECLSRECCEVHFVEKNKKSIAIIEKNLAKLKITEDYKIINQDVMSFFKKYDGPPYDLILIDPPFTEKMAHDVIAALASTLLFHSETIIAIESARKERLEDFYSPLKRYDIREFGDKHLSFFKKEDNHNEHEADQ
jgi:16S rRNA (guanine966-N2)-methyltransferase